MQERSAEGDKEIMQKIKDLYSNIRGSASGGTPKEGEEEKE